MPGKSAPTTSISISARFRVRKAIQERVTETSISSTSLRPTKTSPSRWLNDKLKQEDIPAILDKLTLPRGSAQEKNFLAELASLKAPRLSINDAQQRIADEALDRLASVQAPPYAFSGVAGTKHSSGTANSVVTGGNTGADLPAMAQTIFHEAMLAYAEKRYGDAQTLLQSAIQSAPGSIDVNYYLGICRLRWATAQQ